MGTHSVRLLKPFSSKKTKIYSMKGVSTLIAFVLTVGVIISTITVVWLAGKPVIERSKDSAIISEGKSVLNSLDGVIKDVVYGKSGSSRTVTLSISGGEYSVNSNDDSIEFLTKTDVSLIEPNAQIISGNLYRAGSRGVTASQKNINGIDSLVLENSHILFAIQSIPTSSSINMSNLTVLMRNKDLDLNLTPIDSSVYVNDLTSTKTGTGYTYFVDNGTTLGYGQIVAHISSGSYSYDVYYTLGTGADYVLVEVRNATNVNNVTFDLETSLASGTISSQNDYVSYYNSTVATALYDDGLKSLSVTNSGNKLRIKQNYDGNGIMQIMTTGPISTIENAVIEDVREWPGSFGYGVDKEAKYYTWLYYPIVDFTQNLTFGKGQHKLYIYNNGTSNGKAQIEIGMI